MEKGKERWGMIADDIWDMILGKAGRLPGKLAPEIIEKADLVTEMCEVKHYFKQGVKAREGIER